MYRNVNDPKRISPYDLQGIARLSSTPPSTFNFPRLSVNSDTVQSHHTKETEQKKSEKDSNKDKNQ